MISPHHTGLKFREDYDAEAGGKVLLNENVVEEIIADELIYT